MFLLHNSGEFMINTDHVKSFKVENGSIVAYVDDGGVFKIMQCENEEDAKNNMTALHLLVGKK